MSEEKVEMQDLAAELEKALDEEPEEKSEDISGIAEQVVPAKVVFKGQEKTVAELEKEWDDWHSDYTVKTQTAAELKRQAEDTLRQAELYYRTAAEVAQQRASVQEEIDDSPYVTPERLEKTLRKAFEPIVQKLQVQEKTSQEMALTREIEKAKAAYPKADEEEILIRGIAEYKAKGRVDLFDIAKKSHERNSQVSTQITPEMEDAIFKKKLAEYRQSKSTITPDSGKTPPLPAEKLKYEDTKSWLEQELKKSTR